MPSHSWRDPHIMRTLHALFKAFYITIGTFLVLFVIIHIGGAVYISHLTQRASVMLNDGIAKDLAYLKIQGDAVANNEELQRYLLAKDSNRLIDLTKEEIKKRSIGLIGVTDEAGITMSRTKSIGRLGNNAFLTTAHGRAVSQNGTEESVEVSGFDPTQLIVTTGRKITQNGVMIGALFANYLMDDAYAEQFRNTYLSPGMQILFYTKEYGVYGNSFAHPTTHALVNAYFNSGSDWIKNGASGKTISFNNGEYYLVENIAFPGLETSPGGALVFIPRRDITNTANSTATLISAIIFLLLVFKYHQRLRKEEQEWRCYLLFGGALFILIALVFFALHIQNTGFLTLERTPYTLYNSTLRLQPDYGIYDRDFEQRIGIIADTGDESINAVQIGLLFDPTAVEIKGFDIASSTCSYVIQNTIDQTSGQAHLSCVVLNPTEGRTSLPIADILVTPKKTGTFTLSFDNNETKVLANDGLGTNVLRSSQSGSYRVDDFDLSESASISPSSTKRTFVVFSPTHPNQSRWYNSRITQFVWQGKHDHVYAYAFDNSPTTIPLKSHTIQGSSISLSIPGDGIFYFHLQSVAGGPIAHYRLQSDLTPPSVASMHLSAEKIVAGDVVRFSFEAEDAGSGVQRNYYVDLGNHLFLPVGSQLFIPFIEPGNQTVILRVYDEAGNYTEQKQIVNVVAK